MWSGLWEQDKLNENNKCLGAQIFHHHEFQFKYNLRMSTQNSVRSGEFSTQQQATAILKRAFTELHIRACFQI